MYREVVNRVQRIPTYTTPGSPIVNFLYTFVRTKETTGTFFLSFFFNYIIPQPPGLFFCFVVFLLFWLCFVSSLCFCARAFSCCGERGPLFITVRGPLTVAASLVAEHRLQMRRFSSCGSRAQLLRGMWDLPRPGLEPVSPALAGRFSTTAPPGKPLVLSYQLNSTVYSDSFPLPSCLLSVPGSHPG